MPHGPGATQNDETTNLRNCVRKFFIIFRLITLCLGSRVDGRWLNYLKAIDGDAGFIDEGKLHGTEL